MNLAAFAQHIGTSRPNVSVMKREGRLVLDEATGLVLVVESMQRIEDTRRARSPLQIVTRNNESRDRKERYEAENARLDYEERCGRLTPIEDIARATLNAGTVVRSRIESAADTLSPRLAPVTDETQVRAILTEWAEALLSETSGAFAAIAATARSKAKSSSGTLQ